MANGAGNNGLWSTIAGIITSVTGVILVGWYLIIIPMREETKNLRDDIIEINTRTVSQARELSALNARTTDCENANNNIRNIIDSVNLRFASQADVNLLKMEIDKFMDIQKSMPRR